MISKVSGMLSSNYPSGFQEPAIIIVSPVVQLKRDITMTKRNIVTAYMNSRHEVIRKIKGVHPNQAAERASGYLANQYFTDPNNRQRPAVYAEVYDEDTSIQHATLKYTPGSGKVVTEYKRPPQSFENRYAVTPLFEESE